MKVSPETYKKIQEWKKNNPEKQKIYAKRAYEKIKEKRSSEYMEKEIQKRINYIINLFKKDEDV